MSRRQIAAQILSEHDLMKKHLRELEAILLAEGLTLLAVIRSKHLKFVCEEGRLVGPATPSDRRSLRNFRGEARRLARRAA